MTKFVLNGHIILVDDNNQDIDNWVVTGGNKTAKELMKENIEDPQREWVNAGGQTLPAAALKGLATAYKNKYKLDSLIIKGQVG